MGSMFVIRHWRRRCNVTVGSAFEFLFQQLRDLAQREHDVQLV